MAIAATAPDLEQRHRFAKLGIRAFFMITQAWHIAEADQLALLDHSVSRATLYKWKQHPPAVLSSDDQLLRLSLIVGIYEGLQRLWHSAPDEADLWIQWPNGRSPFDGRTPAAFIIAGGIPALMATRTVVDSAAGGPPSRDRASCTTASG